jgi:hypothetical protein
MVAYSWLDNFLVPCSSSISNALEKLLDCNPAFLKRSPGTNGTAFAQYYTKITPVCIRIDMQLR